MSSNKYDPAALSRVLQRAAVDLAFRQQLLHEPRAAIKAAFGLVIPDQVRLRFIEKDPALDALVVLPDIASADGELSDDELTTVAGGMESDYSWSEELPPEEELS
jgi:hypothetical protein